MRRVPSIPTSALRDHGSSDRVERIWRRIQPDLLAGNRGVSWPSHSVWIPAALAAMFGFGVFVGTKWARPDHLPPVSAERPVAPEPARPAAAPERAATPAEAPRTPQTRKAPVLDVEQPAELLNLVAPEILPPVLQPVPAGPPEWELLAGDDKFVEARAALETHGGFSSVLGGASPAQLMTLADIARSTGSRDHAILALRRVVEAFPDAAVAPEAALTLGTLLEKAGDGAGAADAFALYRRLSPSGDFAEDALARQVDSALAQGNLEALTRLVAQYENDFPNGPRLEEFRAGLAQRVAAGGSADAGVAGNAPPSHAKDPATVEGAKPPSK